MPQLRSRRRGQALGIALVLLILASCGGSGGNAAPAATCDGTPAADLGAGSLCADNGFRLTPNDFSFPNWAGFNGKTDEISVSTMVRLYGAEAVCTEGTSEFDCVLNPAAEAAVTEWSQAIQGGRCEGMATLAMRYFAGLESTAEISDDATNASALTRPQVNLDQEINLWWATQFMPEVRDAAAQSRKKDPVALVRDLIKGLANNAGYTIGLYGDGFGHAVTPYAVTKDGSVYSVHIYDNNYPGVPAVITVDESTKKWSYVGAAANSDSAAMNWSGSTGTFELTPMNVRTGPFTDEFGADSDETKSYSTVSLAANSADGEPAVGLLITTASGKRVGVANGKPVNEVPNAKYTVGKGGKGTSLVLVEMPPMSESYSVQAVSATSKESTSQRDLTISLTTADGSRTQMTVRKVLNRVTDTSKEFVFDANEGVVVTPTVDALVTIANNKDKIVTRVLKNTSLRTKRGLVTTTDASGKSVKRKQLKKALVRRLAIARTSTSVRTTLVSRLSTSTTFVRRTSTTLRSTSTTLAIRNRFTTTTTVARSSSTIAHSTTTDASATTTTLVPRTSTTLRRLTTTTTTTSVP